MKNKEYFSNQSVLLGKCINNIQYCENNEYFYIQQEYIQHTEEALSAYQELCRKISSNNVYIYQQLNEEVNALSTQCNDIATELAEIWAYYSESVEDECNISNYTASELIYRIKEDIPFLYEIIEELYNE